MMATTRAEAIAATAEALVTAAESIMQGTRPLALAEADQAFGRARARIEAEVEREHGWDARNIVNEAMDLVREACQPKQACGCGRPIRFLNPGSDTPKCICGYAPDLCRCVPLTTERSDPS